jgi:hypothetical protein
MDKMDQKSKGPTRKSDLTDRITANLRANLQRRKTAVTAQKQTEESPKK